MPTRILTRSILRLMACLSLVSAPRLASASELATIRGHVLDPQGAFLPDATVSLAERPAAAITDARGAFRLDRVPLGSHTVRATHIGFAAVTAPIEVTGTTVEPVALQFTREVVTPLDEVVVTGTKTPTILKEAPLPVVVVGQKQIDSYHADHLGDVLDHVPGVTLMPNGFARSSVSIHGLPEEYALVLVDGQRQHGRHADAKDLENIPTDAVERIELVKGPSSVLYGSDAVAGIVNVITREGQSGPMFNLYASGGSKDLYTLRSRGGGALLGWQHHLAGSWNNSGYMGEGYGFRNASLRLNSKKALPGNHRLQASLGYFDEQTEDMPATDDFPGGHYLDDRVGDLQLGWHWQASNISCWNATAYYYDQHRRDNRPGGTPRVWDRGNLRAELQHTTRLGAHNLTGGFETRLESIDYTLIDDTENQQLLGLFVQDEWTLSPRLTLVAAARLERHDRWGTEAVPRVGLAVRPSATTVVRLSGGTSFRAPSLTDLFETQYYHPWGGGYWLGGNPDLEPEKSVGGNLDIEVLGDVAAVSGGLFYNRLTDRIAQEDTGEEIEVDGEAKLVRRSVNKDEAVSQGAEFQVRWLPRPGLRATLGYTYLDTEDKSTGLVFDYAPKHTVDASVSWEPSGQGLNLSVRGKHLGSRYAGASQGRKLDPAYVLDLNAEQRIVSGFSALTAVDNALDEQLYWESRYFEQGRKYRAGLRYRM